MSRAISARPRTPNAIDPMFITSTKTVERQGKQRERGHTRTRPRAQKPSTRFEQKPPHPFPFSELHYFCFYFYLLTRGLLYVYMLRRDRWEAMSLEPKAGVVFTIFTVYISFNSHPSFGHVRVDPPFAHSATISFHLSHSLNYHLTWPRSAARLPS